MTDLWKTIRLGLYVFALPLVATAAASAHQWMNDSSPLTVPEAPIATTVSDGSAIITLRDHSITLDTDGMVKGRLVSFDTKSHEAIGLGGLRVYFARNGEIAKKVVSESDGSFVVEGLEEKAYSFIVAGESGFAAYGVNVISGDSEPTVMEVAAVSPKFTAVQEILENRVPAKIAKEIADLAKTNNEESAPIEVAGSNRVILQDGLLVGSVIPIWGKPQSVDGTYVHIVQDDEQVASARVDEDGNFKFEDMEPGIYDFVAAGPTGFAAVGFEAVEVAETEVNVSIPDESSETVSTDDAESTPQVFAVSVPKTAYTPSAKLNVALTSPEDSAVVGNAVGYANAASNGFPNGYTAEPIEYVGQEVGNACAAGAACGGCGDFSGYSSCAGGGGGGGGLFGGGGFGRLAAIAAIGAAIAIPLATSGDGSGEPPDMSPFLP